MASAGLRPIDRIIGVATLILFVDLFLPWYSYNSGFGGTIHFAATTHGYMWIAMVACIAVLGYYVLTLFGGWSWPANSPFTVDQFLLLATSLSFVFAVIAFLSKPFGGISGVGWSYGAFIGLAAAVVALVPVARPFLQARRGH